MNQNEHQRTLGRQLAVSAMVTSTVMYSQPVMVRIYPGPSPVDEIFLIAEDTLMTRKCPAVDNISVVIDVVKILYNL